MHLVFRDHRLSDLIGFVYSGMPAPDAASHLIQNIKDSAQPVLDNGKNCSRVDHSRRRKCLGILSAIGPRISAPLL